MDIVEEIKFPSTNKDWVQKVLIGGILNIIPIVNFLSSGYNLKVMRGAIEGKPGLPGWEEWGNLFVRGLSGFIISLVYLIIPIIVLFVSLGGMIFSIISSGGMGGGMGAIAGAIGGVMVGFVLMLIFGFFIPMALAMYIKEDNISAAFRLKEVISRIRSVFGDYLTVYIVLIVLSFIVGLVSIIPILGILIMIIGGFYIEVVVFNMFGKVYVKSTH